MPLNGIFGLLQMGVVLGWMGSVVLVAGRWHRARIAAEQMSRSEPTAPSWR